MIVAVIPLYRTKEKCISLIEETLNYVDSIICVDDSCPEFSGLTVEEHFRCNKSINVIYNKINLGVGGACKNGFLAALKIGADIIIKLDSDWQMEPSLISKALPILDKGINICKGNRFSNPRSLVKMPTNRLIGNVGLNFMAKMSTGYWELSDPTNGFFAFKANILKSIDLAKLDNRYLFEADLLFQFGLLNEPISETSMTTSYDNHISSLNVRKELINQGRRHCKLTLKRIVYEYFLINFSPGSLSLLAFLFCLICCVTIGCFSLINSFLNEVETVRGVQVLFLALFFATIQFMLNFIYYDSTQKILYRSLLKAKN